jgi:hypothetical protein
MLSATIFETDLTRFWINNCTSGLPATRSNDYPLGAVKRPLQPLRDYAGADACFCRGARQKQARGLAGSTDL